MKTETPQNPMGFDRLRTIARGALGLVLVAPVIALVPAVLFDRGPSGLPRVSPHLFPVAMWVFDDFAWTCARNSLIFASVISLSALVVGVGVRCLLDRLPSWGRAAAGGAILALVVVSPAFLALGITGFFGAPQPWPWPFHISFGGGTPGASLEAWSGAPLWIAWIWASLPAAVAFVSLTTEPVIARMKPSWEEAARLAGAGSLRIWTTLSWVIIRPAALRAAATVFVLALVEPGAPWILGLRRTLAFQIIDAAAGADPFPGVAVWAIMAGLFGFCGWAVFRSRGGPVILTGQSSATCASRSPRQRRRVSARLALVASLALAGWALACWVPVLGLVRLGLGAGTDLSGSERGGFASLLDLSRRASDEPVPELAANSLEFGFEVACATVLLAWLARRGWPGPSWAKIAARFVRPLVHMPPLVQATGVLSLTWLAGLAAQSALLGGWSTAGLALERVASVLSPHQNSWTLMVCGVCLALVPCFADRGRPGEEQSRGSRHVDSAFGAALLAGRSRMRARALGKRWRRRRALARFLLVWALAATNVTPALLFLPWTDRHTAGPAVLVYSSLGRPAQPAALAPALALGCIAVNVVAFAFARATSAVPPVDDLD
jgi:iron(III) transport system permease protein